MGNAKLITLPDGQKHWGGETHTYAQLRTINIAPPLIANAEIDTTNFMRIHLHNDFEFYSNLNPSIKRFQVIKNNNVELTKNNAILELVIPILPVGYMSETEEDFEKLIVKGESLEDIQAENDKVPQKEQEKRIKEHSDEALNYILFSIAERFYIALKNNDKKTMALLSNLKIVKELNFDFGTFSKLKNNENVDFHFTMAHKTYLTTQEKYNKILRVINEYSEYDVKQELSEMNTSHSLNHGSKKSKNLSNQNQPGQE